MHEGTPDCTRDPQTCNMRGARDWHCMVKRGGGKCPVKIQTDKVKRLGEAQGQLKMKFEEA